MKILTAVRATVQSPDYIRINVEFDPDGLTPRELRRVFANAIRLAITKAMITGDLGSHLAEELWRVTPNPEAA